MKHLSNAHISNRPYQHLPKAALWQMRILSFISVLVLTVFLSVVSIIFKPIIAQSLGWSISSGSIGMGVLAVFLVLIALYWVLSGIQYHYTGYHLGEEGLAIRQGMLWRKETFVPRSRVQHIDVARHPLSRALGLAKLQVYTAGTKLGSVSLDGLTLNDAQCIRDELISNVQDTL